MLLLITSIAWAQPVYNVKLNWLPNKLELIGGKETPVLQIANGSYLSIDKGLPSIMLTPSFAEIELSKMTYLPLTDDEVKLIDTTLIDHESPKIHVLTGTRYKRPIVSTFVLPFRKNSESNQFEKLLSFEYKNKSSKNIVSKSLFREAASGTFGSTKSVLAEGEWFKLAIAGSVNSTGSGMYKLDYKFLNSIGFPVATVDPRKIRLHGNGTGMLPILNATSRADDLIENAIYVVGEADGKFDPSDYILFYAKGPHEWKYDTREKEFYHIKNLYSEEAFYFLTFSENIDGKRVQPVFTNFAGGIEVSTTPAHEFYESDDFNLLQSGKKWYSKAVENPLNFQFNTQGIVPNTSMLLTTAAMAQAIVQTAFTFNVAGQSFKQNLGVYNFRDQYGTKGVENTQIFTINNISGNSLNVNALYNKSGSEFSKGYLDYIEVAFTKQIGLYGNQSEFYILGNAAKVQTSVKVATSQPSSTIIWDITSLEAYTAVVANAIGNELFFADTITSLRSFITFTGSNFPNPSFAGKIANQNLHGMANGNLPDMVIVTIPSFMPAANELKAFRKSYNNLDVEVVTTDQIYNEFSSGKQDLTAIRDFFRLLYKRSNSSDSISYALLFGACSYDYKNRVQPNTNYVPIYESIQSLDNVSSFSSDDYVVSLDDNEGGAWNNEGNVINTVDLGLGRLPVRSAEEALAVVNKIKVYHSHPESKGKWRNKVSFVADDTTPREIGYPNHHAQNSEKASDVVERVDKNLNIGKYYVDSYQQIITPGGEISPQINEAVLNNINSGTLLVNYSGHGSEFVWAQVGIVNINDINGLKNTYNLPFFVTATCEFGRYDDPAKFSGGMSLSLNPIGGGIGLLCSARPVYASSNTSLNKAFYSSLFPSSSKKRIYPTMGKVTMETKNDGSINNIENTRNYALLCDPSLTLAFPKKEVVMTSINGKAYTDQSRDTLKALSVVTIKGEIQNQGVFQKDFVGTVNLSLFDKTNTVSTIGAYPNKVMQFKLRNSLIYDGSVLVDSGKFTFQFVVPKDINYSIGSCKFSFYAHTKDGKEDAGSADTTVQLGGSSATIAFDNTPPVIRLYMNDTTFINGGLTRTDTKLIAKLFDENGINISSSGIGHQITGLLSGNKKVLVMNEFYTTTNNSYKHGLVEYPFNKLQPGNYTLQFKAWDTYNNSSTSEIEFIVSDNQKFALQEVMNFPNPFIEKTTFKFGHNRAGDDLEVVIEITDDLGTRVKTITKTVNNSPSVLSEIDWEGIDDSGTRLSSGSYIYKITVTSQTDKANAFKILRMVLIN